MKVIGKQNQYNYIVVLTDGELQKVLGIERLGNDEKERIDQVIKTGEDLNISSIYLKHYDLQQVLRGDNVKDARKALEALLKKLTPIEEIFTKLPIEPKK